ncbi:MAG: PDZ domain-containing protein [Dehalococcoidales bacterium]|nr:PDZ domain-containing protein [Dehalococcoidales bacterium]
MRIALFIMLALVLPLAGCGTVEETPEAAEPENVAVQSFEEALFAGDIDTCLGLVSDDMVFRQDHAGLVFEGKEQIKGILEFLAGWNFHWSATNSYNVDGNKVTFSANMRSDHYKLFGTEQTRARLEFIIQDGKISSFTIIENEDDSDRLDELTRGSIGVQLEMGVRGSDNGIRVSEVTDNSPAEKAGIKPGDLIVTIDKLGCSEMTRPQEAQLRLMGQVGSKVSLTVACEGVAIPINMEITRAELSGLQ